MAGLSLMAHSPAAGATPSRVSTGLPALDRLLDGGLPKHRSVVVCGASGTGKTTFGLQFLVTGIALGERGMLALVDEKPRHLIEDARAFGWDLEAWTDGKRLRLLDASPYFSALAKPHREPTAREIAADLTGQIRGFRAQRLVIDPVTSLVPRDRSPADVREFLRTLIFALEDNLGVTTLLIAPRTAGAPCAGAVAEELASGVLELSVVANGGERTRALSIAKMRGTPVEPLQLGVRIARGQGLTAVGSPGAPSARSPGDGQ